MKRGPGRTAAAATVGAALLLLPLAAALGRATDSRSSPSGDAPGGPIRFHNVTERTGIAEHLVGWERGHAAAWGDVTGNGLPDLYLGAFSDHESFEGPGAPAPNMLLLNEGDRFRLSTDPAVGFRGTGVRTSMAVFADLENDGLLDLVVGTHASRGPGGTVLRNHGADGFRPRSERPWPADLQSRNIVPLDLDRDGLLDLLVVDGRYGGSDQGLLALRNLGDHRFEDVSEAYGFPAGGTRGLGTAVGDVNDDGRLDVFVADRNRLFLSRPDGTYEEHLPGFFHLDVPEVAGWPCGAAFADLTGNGLLDLVVTVHADARTSEPQIPGHVFLWVNRGLDAEGRPRFEEATEAAGLDILLPRTGSTGVMLKAAQVALVDVDSDGRRDILMGLVHEDARGELQPVVFRNLGVEGGVPRFDVPPVASVVGYYAAAPVADYDRDGRLDIFMATWFPELGSHLFRNVTEGGNHLAVRVEGRAGDLNRMGVGATVRLYRSGHAGEEDQLLARGDVALANGYSSGEEAVAHFGLGGETAVDIVVTWQGRTVTRGEVGANRAVTVEVGD